MSPDAVSPEVSTRGRIKTVAQQLYVLRGHDGLSFGDVAEVVGITRANIHHHFGNKRQLMDALIAEFAADAQARIAHHWVDGRAPLAARLGAQLDDLRRFYERFNTAPGERNVWSPIARLRLDLPALGPPAAAALAAVDACYETSLGRALAGAVAAGELRPDAPLAEIGRVLRVVLLSCPPMTQDTGGFAEIERLFGALDRTVLEAWRVPKRRAQRRLTPPPHRS